LIYFSNDNGPQFDRQLYTIAVDAHTSVGTQLITVHAQDPDLINGNDNSTTTTVLYRVDDIIYRYRARNRQLNDYIRIDQHTGCVSLTQPIDEFSQGVFEVKINSADLHNESEAQIASTMIKVAVV
jgi:hypothetical protein